MVVISRDKRVDSKRLSKLLGEKFEIADANAVRREMGYVIGGVPPFPHDEGVRVILDSSLERFEEVLAATGTPHSVMKLSVEALNGLVGGDFVDVARR